MKKLLKLPNLQLIRYIITGGGTTAVNYGIYIGLTVLSCNYIIANMIAWVFAVLFAYGMNKHVVFHAKGGKTEEFLQFISLRFVTLLVESALLLVGIEWLGMHEFITKIAVSVLTVTMNYVTCKYSIFKERGISHESQS